MSGAGQDGLFGGEAASTCIEKAGDLFSVECEAIANPVNCEGVMGKGLALEFKKRFPANFQAYRKACGDGGLAIGKPFCFQLGDDATSPRWIVNFPTKDRWRDLSRLEDVEQGLAALVEWCGRESVQSLALPALGCGLGGLSWPDVRSAIQSAFANSGTALRLLPPRPEAEPKPKPAPPAAQPQSGGPAAPSPPPRPGVGSAALVVMAQSHLNVTGEAPTVERLQALAYFMQMGNPKALAAFDGAVTSVKVQQACAALQKDGTLRAVGGGLAPADGATAAAAKDLGRHSAAFVATAKALDVFGQVPAEHLRLAAAVHRALRTGEPSLDGVEAAARLAQSVGAEADADAVPQLVQGLIAASALRGDEAPWVAELADEGPAP